MAATTATDLRTGGHGPVATLASVPVFCNALYDTAAEAVAAPRGDVELWFSPDSGYLWNAAFDPDLVAYSPRYENSLHHSPRFAAYADALAHRLVDTYDVRGKQVVEIGAGEANFLSMLCELGPNDGIGYDPSHDPGRPKVVSSPRARIVAEYFPTEGVVDADLVVCQHVLEHVWDPAALLVSVRRTLRPDTVLYLEVPDATYMVDHLAVWDLIYEHCSYFAAPTLAELVRRCGFEVLEVGRSFGDQYLYLEARPAARADGTAVRPGPAEADARQHLGDAVSRFDAHLRDLVRRWDARLAELSAKGRVAVWGAGSKGATFANLVPSARAVAAVVDVNPNKVGRHVPGTGHRIVAPTELPALGVQHVVVMNPLYAAEIAAQISALGVDAEVVVVNE